jgi:hypothetical protein
VDNDVLRVGGHWQVGPGFHTLASLIDARRRTSDDVLVGLPTRRATDHSLQFELQQQFVTEIGNAIGGLSAYKLDGRSSRETIFGDDRLATHDEGSATSAYLYTTLQVTNQLDLTLGLSFTSLDLEDPDYDSHDPLDKLGLSWVPLAGLTIRAATFSIVKPPLSVNQTIEPTQVAGFKTLR